MITQYNAHAVTPAILYARIEWVDALRSGKYQQIQGTLRRDDGFCCLGVASDLCINSRIYGDDVRWYARQTNDETEVKFALPAEPLPGTNTERYEGVLPFWMRAQLGLHSDNGVLDFGYFDRRNNPMVIALAELNDGTDDEVDRYEKDGTYWVENVTTVHTFDQIADVIDYFLVRPFVEQIDCFPVSEDDDNAIDIRLTDVDDTEA